MAVARDAVELGRAARAAGEDEGAPAAVGGGRGRGRVASAARSQRFSDLLLEDLNVKTVRFVSEAEELGRWELKPNYRALGPRFGKHMPQVAEAVAALDAQRAAATLRAGGSVGIADRRQGAPAWPPTTCSSCSSRSRATGSSARAPTRSR